jgi:hypothetical protein
MLNLPTQICRITNKEHTSEEIIDATQLLTYDVFIKDNEKSHKPDTNTPNSYLRNFSKKSSHIRARGKKRFKVALAIILLTLPTITITK